MASSTMALAYGLCVRVPDLVAAGRAFAQAKPTLLAVGIIRRRRERGTLVAQTAGGAGSAAARVPPEVWEMIGADVIGGCVVDARRGMHGEVCEACHGGFRAGASARSLLEAEWLFHQGRQDDELYADKLMTALSQLENELTQAASPLVSPNAVAVADLHSLLQPLRALLQSYNLYLPVPANLQPKIIFWDLTTPITSLAVRPTDRVWPGAACDADGPDNGEDGASSVVDVPVSVFSLPANADGQIGKLMRAYHVRAVERARVPGPQRAAGRSRTWAVRQREPEKEGDKSAVPSRQAKWMLVQCLTVEY